MNISDLYRQLFGRSGTTKGSDIDMSEHGRVGGVSTGQPFKFIHEVEYATKVTIDGQITYVGIAAPGTLESEAKWQCKMIDSSVAGTTAVTWADGNANFDNIATDLTGLTYS
jgi:hypothetical protein